MMKRLFLILALVLMCGPQAFAEGSALRINVDHGVPLTLNAPAVSIFIANPDIADVQVMSPTSIMIFGKRTGETTFMASDGNGRTLAQRTVMVVQDLSDLRQELDTAIPGNKIKIQSLPNGLALTGEARDAGAVADAYKIAMRYLPSGGDIINRIKVVGSNQINIRVRFAEVQRNIDNTLGFNWQNMNEIGGITFGLATGVSGAAAANGGPNIGDALGKGLSSIPNILSNRPSNTTLGQPNNLLTFQHGNVNGLIDALAQDGLITILAEPNLTAMSGETASFLAGGEFPIPIPQGLGNISIEFKKYGISLEFTPTLISENRINLHVKPEVSELTQTGSIILDSITVPALTTRKAETTIEVASGQSFAIAGLLDNNQAQTVNKYPLLGDLPVIGALFRSDHFVNGQTELVVVITPYIVTPSGQQLALPTDGFSPPSETDRLVGLRYSSSDPQARPMSGDATAQKVMAAPALPVPSDVAPAPVPAPVSEVAPVLQGVPAGSSPTFSRTTTPTSTTVTVTPPPAPTDVPTVTPADVHAAAPLAAPPAPSAPSVPAFVPAPVALRPSPAAVTFNPAPAAPAPLRGTASGTAAPVGPGGFLVE